MSIQDKLNRCIFNSQKKYAFTYHDTEIVKKIIDTITGAGELQENWFGIFVKIIERISAGRGVVDSNVNGGKIVSLPVDNRTYMAAAYRTVQLNKKEYKEIYNFSIRQYNQTPAQETESSDKISEILEISNFLSISYMKWEINDFNIITGDMGAGKSLCIKLLNFFEKILVSFILLDPDLSKKIFENGNFFDKLSERFRETFFLSTNDCHDLNLYYICKTKSRDFSVMVSWDESRKKLVWECDYLEERLKKWSGYFPEWETPDTVQEVRNQIHAEIKHDFDDKLPFSNFFVPASRAAVAVIGRNTTLNDSFLNSFIETKDFLLSDLKSGLNSNKGKNKLAEILKVRKIRKSPNDENEALLELNDGRTVPLLFSSSGQQELLYLLLLLEQLPEITFRYGKTISLFIEEPSAHLFPKEQKEVIECIVALFRNEKNMDTRFFITTHSPYILNSFNNILKKGNLLKTYKTMEYEINNTVTIPHLDIDEVSAYFLGTDPHKEGKFTGKSMFDDDRKYLDAAQIASISESIYEDTEKLINFEYKVKNNI